MMGFNSDKSIRCWVLCGLDSGEQVPSNLDICCVGGFFAKVCVSFVSLTLHLQNAFDVKGGSLT